jgi:hypothetical protein
MVGLCDKARMVRNVPSSVKVAGRTVMTQVFDTWFRGRLTVNTQVEAEDPGGQRVRAVKTAQLLYGVKDSEGHPVLLTADDRLEIDAKSIDVSVWALTSHPQALRRRSGRLIGFTVDVQRVDDERTP